MSSEGDDFPLKPWMIVNDRGSLLCLMCPSDRENYYAGISLRRKTRRQVIRWLKKHRRCGFKGLS